ncbi:MAG: TfoX/Sxy family protein [Sediminibacterium magnilacihabitans]|jgi:TfoX/Sxy family transcriptional regulator of competence genes|nr:TfoX/Sxy family protein [Sediminibacterium magnilacihabitans]PQV62163.1 TfoX-like protein [Sediminibacterium magnilacihabitans]
MAYSEHLGKRIREAIAHISDVEEKAMMGGLTFMINDKMCIGIIGDEMMCRIDPALQETVLEKTGCRIMDFTGKPMKGYVMVGDSGMKSKRELTYWINLCLDFNKRAKSSKKKSKKQ